MRSDYGRLVAVLPGDSVVIASGRRDTLVLGISRIAVANGNYHPVGKGFIWGLILGAAPFAIAGIKERPGQFQGGPVGPLGAVIGGAFGAFGGAILGAKLTSTRWVDIRLSSLHPTRQ